MSKIYESPDGGKTVYERKSGNPSQKLIKKSSYSLFDFPEDFYQDSDFQIDSDFEKLINDIINRQDRIYEDVPVDIQQKIKYIKNNVK